MVGYFRQIFERQSKEIIIKFNLIKIKKMERSKKGSVELKDFKIRNVVIEVEGISPLITNKFSNKAQAMIEAKQQGKSKNAKHEIKVPENDYENAKHKSPQGWEGFPAAGYKAAMTRGAKMVGMVMKDTQTSFFVKADCEETQLVRTYGKSRMRTDMVRIGMGSADVRYRPEYPVWSAKLIIEFNEGVLSLEQIYQMVSAAGYGCGIGEMRPEKGKFSFGRFKIKGT
jgi:hypothetical protein